MKKEFTCRTCGEKFESRSELGKHIQAEHQSKEVIIPEELVPELTLVGKDRQARVVCDGIKVDGGLKIHTFKFDR